MGCKVEKIILPTGASSDLYRDLIHSMPQGRALETYLELTTNKEEFVKVYGENSQGEVNADNAIGTPKFKLPEFESYEITITKEINL